MLKTKVTCWFCSQDSQVFVFNKNSWTCTHCDQYNGFNKDGDYNKVIPEMHRETRAVKYCTTSGDDSSPPRSSSGGNSLLCDKCNQNQELKLTELSKFESKYDVSSTSSDKFDREYKLYKKKLDHVYDLCKPCKLRLDNHLRSIDQQIGDAYYVRNRTNGSTSVTTASSIMMNGGAASLTSLNGNTKVVSKPVENNKQQKLNGVMMEHTESSSSGFSICDNLKSTFQKAYTVAGTVPAYVFSNNSNSSLNDSQRSPSTKLRYRKHEIAPATTTHNDDHHHSTRDYMNDSIINTSRAIKSPAEISMGSTRGFTCDSLLIVFEDLFALLFILMVCACDIVNLVNDSGVLLIEKNSSNEWYNSLLDIYKQVNLMLAFTSLLAAHLFYKRPKLSRFLMLLGLVFNLLIHSQLAFDLKTEEQFISECFISVFLAAYLVFARSYNLLQLIGIV